MLSVMSLKREPRGQIGSRVVVEDFGLSDEQGEQKVSK